jgi:iron(III) transport system substrate-binding protein
MRRRKAVLAGLATMALLGASCGSDTTEGAERRSLTVYSGREEEFVADLFEQFEADAGIQLDVRYGDSAELAATLLEEGASSPADVFLSQDSGALGAVAKRDLLVELPEEILERIDRRFVSPDGVWAGTSGRARVAAYSTEKVDGADLPDSILDFTDPRWKGRIGFPPTNSSFQAFVAAMILTEGEAATRSFLEGLVDNKPKMYEDNSSTVRAIASGEIEVGFVNHYYIYEVAAEDGDIPVANHFFTGGDPGALVNAAGVGVIDGSENQEEAIELVDYLTGDEGQTYFAEETFEYPVVPEHTPSEDLVPLEQIESPDVDLSDLSGALEPALNLLAKVGLL